MGRLRRWATRIAWASAALMAWVAAVLGGGGFVSGRDMPGLLGGRCGGRIGWEGMNENARRGVVRTPCWRLTWPAMSMEESRRIDETFVHTLFEYDDGM